MFRQSKLPADTIMSRVRVQAHQSALMPYVTLVKRYMSEAAERARTRQRRSLGGFFEAVWNAAVAMGAWASDQLLAPAMVAVVFTGLTNLYLERRKATRDLATKITDTLREDLRSLQMLSVEYWARDRKEEDPALEARILAVQEEVQRTVALLADEFELNVYADDDPRPELLDSLTGGDFRSAERKADLGRVLRGSKAVDDLRSRVIQQRAARLRRRGS